MTILGIHITADQNETYQTHTNVYSYILIYTTMVIT